jgi:acyl-CoA thioesterase
MGVPAGDYLLDTRPEPVPGVPGRFRATIPDAWNVFSMFGGVSMGFALRAAQAGVERDDLRPLAASAVFATRVPCGPVSADVEVLRSGRRAAQAVALLRVPGVDEPALRLQATFAGPAHTDLAFLGVAPPAVPDPDDCEPPPAERDDNPFPKVNFHEQSDYRPAMPLRAWDPEVRRREAGVPEAASWVRLRKPPRHDDGAYDWSALCVPGDQLGSGVGRMLAATHPDVAFFVITLELGLRFVARPATDWILQHVHAWVGADGYATGDIRLWDEHRNLCAVGTQTALLRPMPAGGPGQG